MHNNSAREYLPTDHEHNGNGNGNGKPKFSITPAVDEDLNAVAPRLRHAARCSDKITDGAKVLFDHLTDLSFLRNVSPGRGIVTMSKRKLSKQLKCSVRTISRYQAELEGVRFIWTKTFWKGGFELTNWFVRGLANAQEELWNGEVDHSWGGSTEERKGRRPRARNDGGKFIKTKPEPTTVNPVHVAKSAVLTDLTAANGQDCPLTTVNPDRGQRSNLTADNGQDCPLTTVNPDRGQRSILTADNGQNCPEPVDKPDREPRSAVSAFKESGADYGAGSTSKAVKRLGKRSGERIPETGESRQAGTAGAVQRQSENEFMLLCRDTLGSHEMTKGGPKGDGNGGLWRILFRQNPDKAWRVMRDVKETQKTRPTEIRTTAAKFAMNLWQQFK